MYLFLSLLFKLIFCFVLFFLRGFFGGFVLFFSQLYSTEDLKYKLGSCIMSTEEKDRVAVWWSSVSWDARPAFLASSDTGHNVGTVQYPETLPQSCGSLPHRIMSSDEGKKKDSDGEQQLAFIEVHAGLLHTQRVCPWEQGSSLYNTL